MCWLTRFAKVGGAMTKIPTELSVFCGWGEGPDVGFNVHHNGELIPIDMTADEALLLAETITACALRAKELDKQMDEHLGAFERKTDG